MFLQEKDVVDIIKTVNTQNGTLTWMVVPDARFTQNPFLPATPEELMSEGYFNTEIEVMVGHNSDDGVLFFIPYFSGLYGVHLAHVVRVEKNILP